MLFYAMLSRTIVAGERSCSTYWLPKQGNTFMIELDSGRLRNPPCGLVGKPPPGTRDDLHEGSTNLARRSELPCLPDDRGKRKRRRIASQGDVQASTESEETEVGALGRNNEMESTA